MSNSAQKQCFPSDLRFSFDLETTGLIHEMPDGKPFLLEIALVPFSVKTGQIHKDQALHLYHQVPSMADMKKMGKVSSFVLNDKNLTQVCHEAHTQGISIADMQKQIEDYLDTYRTAPEASGNPSKAVILSKSIAGLDRPMLIQAFGNQWVEKTFHYRMIDLTSCSTMVADARLGIVDSTSPNALVKQMLGIDSVPHTALEDAYLLGQVYLILLNKLQDITKKTA